MAEFMGRVVPVIDDTIRALTRSKFIADPRESNRHKIWQEDAFQGAKESIAVEARLVAMRLR